MTASPLVARGVVRRYADRVVLDGVDLAQELDAGATATVADVLAEALEPLHAALGGLEELAGQLADSAVSDEYAARLDWCTSHDAWDASRRAEEAAHRLGLGDVPPDRPVASLSGGRRSRLALRRCSPAGPPACCSTSRPTTSPWRRPTSSRGR